MPTLATGPKPLSQASSSPCPGARGGELGHARAGRRCGRAAAATFRSKWVSTPPVTGRAGSTIVIAIPSLAICQGVARAAPGVRRRCDRPVGAGRSAAPGHGLCHWKPGAGRQIVLKTG